MAVLRWDPWGEIAALQRDVNHLLGRPLGRVERDGASVPAIDAVRSEDGLTVRVDLPGVRPDDVDVAVHDNVLTIAGERHEESSVREDDWVRRERLTGRFERSFTLPEGTNAGAITASFEHGVLTVQIPHPPERKPHRIEVQSGASQARETVNIG